jgi:hypothetical protein
MTNPTCKCEDIDCIIYTDTFQKDLSNLAKNPMYNNKQRRFNAYRAAAAGLNLTYRQKLPVCVEDYIKATFSEETGNYTGFKR